MGPIHTICHLLDHFTVSETGAALVKCVCSYQVVGPTLGSCNQLWHMHVAVGNSQVYKSHPRAA